MRPFLLPVLLGFAAAVGAGCGDGGGGDDDGAGPVDAAAAIDGAWRITRIAPSQPAGCRAITPNPLDVTFAFGAAAPIVVASDSMLRDYDQVVAATTAAFVTQDFGAFSSESGRPVLIIHRLRVAGDQLTGTGTAMGDGDDIGCQWTMDLVGTRR